MGVLDGYEGYIWACDACGEKFDHSHSETCPHETAECLCGQDAKYYAEGSHEIREGWEQFFILPAHNSKGQQQHYRASGHCGNPPGTPQDFPHYLCRKCAIRLSPAVQRFADIWLTNIFNGRLQRAINEKRKQGRTENNRPASDDACPCCKRRYAGDA